MPRPRPPNVIHLLAHANPLGGDLAQLGFADLDAYLLFIREHLPPTLVLRLDRAILSAIERPEAGGRSDDDARVRDLQRAISSPSSLALVALSGGAWLSRILPRLDFSPLARRSTPLWALGFSEMTGLVNAVAARRGGRGVYWLCPNYLAWRCASVADARERFADFWRALPELLGGDSAARRPLRLLPAAEADRASENAMVRLWNSPIECRKAAGVVRSGPMRVVGGCLSVLAALAGGRLLPAATIRDAWLLIEDHKEAAYRNDRHLAALTNAGWFERLAGVLVGDFHAEGRSTAQEVLALLPYHVPRARRRRFPVLTTAQVGHVWPMSPIELNRRLHLDVRGERIQLRR